MFRNLMESLTSQQIYFLQAVLDGHRKMTASTLLGYGISSSTSASRSKKYFVDEDIIDGISMELLDPVFAAWLRRVYFRR